MKSHATFLADFRQAEFPKVIDLTCPEAHMQKELRNLTRSKKWTETPETIENGDVVTLALASGLPRFNRPMIPVTVGDGLYDAELEAQLLGHGVGDTFTATVQGQDVAVTVKQAVRTVFPEPTDEMVAAYAAGRKGMEDIRTVSDLRKWIVSEYQSHCRRNAVVEGIGACMNYVIANSAWSLDEEEVICLAQKMATAREADNGQPTDEQLSTSRRILSRLLWLAAQHGLDPADAEMEDLMRLDLQFVEEFVAAQLQFVN